MAVWSEDEDEDELCREEFSAYRRRGRERSREIGGMRYLGWLVWSWRAEVRAGVVAEVMDLSAVGW